MNSSASAPSLSQVMWFASLPLRSARIASSASAGLSSTRRMSTSSNLSIWSSFRQRKIERGSFAHFALGPDPPAVPGHHAPHDGKADAGSRKLLRRMQPLEHAEKLVVVLHIESGAVVLDAVHALRAVLMAAHLDQRLLALAAELDRVRQQIDPHLLDRRRVAPRFGKGMDLDPLPHGGRRRADLGQC